MEQTERLKHRMPAQLRWSDVDQFGHVNNSVYFSLYDLAKTTYIKEVVGQEDLTQTAIVVANINANFFVPIYFKEHIEIDTSVIHLGNKSFTLLQRAVVPETGQIKCECRTVMVCYDLLAGQPCPIREEHKLAVCTFEGKTLEELSQSPHEDSRTNG